MRGTMYGAEVEEIQAFRKANPSPSAFKAAKQFKETGTQDIRSFYSIYSVIRRFDAAQKTKKANKATKKAVHLANLNADSVGV